METGPDPFAARYASNQWRERRSVSEFRLKTSQAAASWVAEVRGQQQVDLPGGGGGSSLSVRWPVIDVEWLWCPESSVIIILSVCYCRCFFHLCSVFQIRCGKLPAACCILVHHGKLQQPERHRPKPLDHQDACGKKPARTHLKHTPALKTHRLCYNVCVRGRGLPPSCGALCRWLQGTR